MFFYAKWRGGKPAPYGVYPTRFNTVGADSISARVRYLRGVEGARPYGVYPSRFNTVGADSISARVRYLRDDVGIVPYGSYPTLVRGCRAGACSRRVRVLRGVEGAAPYGVYRGWCEVVGATFGRPFIIAYGDAGRETRPLRGLSDVIVNL